MFDLVLTGGTVITGAESQEATIAVKDGRIASILPRLAKPEANVTVDISGKLAIPGAIDAHVHVRTIYNPAADTIRTASVAAAYGGITSFFIFIGVSKGTKAVPGTVYRTIDATGIQVEEYFEPIIHEGQHSSVIDFGIHCMLPPDSSFVEQIPRAVRMGITTFKIMQGYHPTRGWTIDDYLLMSVLDKIAGCGGTAMFHCENGNVIGYLEEKLLQDKQYDAAHFLKSRPNVLEAETLYRMGILCHTSGCPMYVVHLSTREGLDNLERLRKLGWNLSAETCPQYLILTDDDLQRQGALLKMAPPLRTIADQEALWDGIRHGSIEVVASDHAPWEKDSQKLATPDFNAAPFGAPGVETVLPLLYSEGVVKGRITVNQLVQLLCENPAKKCGVWPRKGSFNMGADADITVVDPDMKWTITANELHSSAGYTGYEGKKVIGKPVMSFVRGIPVLRDGQVRATPGEVRYLSRTAVCR